MNDSFGVTLAVFVIAASAITARYLSAADDKPARVTSVEPDLRDWSDWSGPPPPCMWAEPLQPVEELPVDDWGPPSCVGRKNDDHCFREMYRAQLEALEASTWYDEVRAVSPTGASFAKPTLVRSSLGNDI